MLHFNQNQVKIITFWVQLCVTFGIFLADLSVAPEGLVELPGLAVADAERAEGGGLEATVAQLLGQGELEWVGGLGLVHFYSSLEIRFNP